MTITVKPMAGLKLYTGLSSDNKPGLTEADYGSHLFITDKRAFYFWDGDAWVPFSSGRVVLASKNPFTPRNSANAAGDATYVNLANVTVPAGLIDVNSVLRIQVFWRMTTNAGSTKNMRIKVGNTVIYTDPRTNSQGSSINTSVFWNGNLTTGYCPPWNGENGNSSNAWVSVTDDMSQAQTIAFDCAWGAAANAELIQLDRYHVEVILGVP